MTEETDKAPCGKSLTLCTIRAWSQSNWGYDIMVEEKSMYYIANSFGYIRIICAYIRAANQTYRRIRWETCELWNKLFDPHGLAETAQPSALVARSHKIYTQCKCAFMLKVTFYFWSPTFSRVFESSPWTCITVVIKSLRFPIWSIGANVTVGASKSGGKVWVQCLCWEISLLKVWWRSSYFRFLAPHVNFKTFCWVIKNKTWNSHFLMHEITLSWKNF